MESSIDLLTKAISFAARAHQGQFRKDNETPYVSHVFRVCFILRQVFGVEDSIMLAAAVLHDTIEDTTTDYDDLEKHFGAKVADLVAVLSKDKRQRDDKREEAYRHQLFKASDEAKIIKLADLYDNLLDSSSEMRPKTAKKAGTHLKNLKKSASSRVKKAIKVVEKLVG